MGESVHIRDYSGKVVHMSGIGGSSMSGLARLLKWRGCQVRGSDRDDSYAVKGLVQSGVSVVVGHYPENVHGADLFIYSAAIAPDNPERVEAARLGIPQMERSVLLGQLSDSYARSIAVSGTHGKTTVTAMLAQLLLECGCDPNVHIGGVLDAIGGSVRTGASDMFITEADEFARSFLTLSPTIAIILNIDADHLDIYKDIEDIERTFALFAAKVKPGGVIISCGDDERAARVARNADARCVLFGRNDMCGYRISNIHEDETACYSFDIVAKGVATRIRLSVPGYHSALDAAAAFACAVELGIEPNDAAGALARFKGAHRRFERTGEVCGVEIYHDYGHNPNEYASVVPVARKMAKNRLFVVFQPHTYSRAKALIDGFGPAFTGADEVLVTNIYAAREVDPGDIKSSDLIERMRGFGYRPVYCPDFAACQRYLRQSWQPGDFVLTVGCGNVNLLNDILLKDS